VREYSYISPCVRDESYGLLQRIARKRTEDCNWQAAEGPERCCPSHYWNSEVWSGSDAHPSQWTALAGRPTTRCLQTVHDGEQVCTVGRRSTLQNSVCLSRTYLVVVISALLPVVFWTTLAITLAGVHFRMPALTTGTSFLTTCETQFPSLHLNAP